MDKVDEKDVFVSLEFGLLAEKQRIQKVLDTCPLGIFYVYVRYWRLIGFNSLFCLLFNYHRQALELQKKV